MKKIFNNQKGYTLIEVLVVVSLFVVIILITGSLYSLSQKSYNKGANKGELVQNVRVCLDRISREIRQSVDIITALPATSTEDLAEEIFFMDGHDTSRITYIYYYLAGDELIRQHRAYYFPAEPATYVMLSSVDGGGNLPEEAILEDRVVGEYFNSLGFWGLDDLVYIELELEKNNNIIKANTAVYSRNR